MKPKTKSVYRRMFSKDDTVVAVFSQYLEGPGWRNRPIWVIVRRGSVLREECIQPADQTDIMNELFHICEVSHKGMLDAVNNAIHESREN